MNKIITIFFIVCPISVVLFLGFSVGIFFGCILLTVVSILFIYSLPSFVAQRVWYRYEMESNIINVLRKNAFGCDMQHGWLRMYEIRQEVDKIFDDGVTHEDQFWKSFKRLRNLKKILKKVIEPQQKGKKVIRVYRLNENSKYKPKRPHRHSGKKELQEVHIHA